jgi:hypothetical protein
MLELMLVEQELSDYVAQLVLGSLEPHRLDLLFASMDWQC